MNGNDSLQISSIDCLIDRPNPIAAGHFRVITIQYSNGHIY